MSISDLVNDEPDNSSPAEVSGETPSAGEGTTTPLTDVSATESGAPTPVESVASTPEPEAKPADAILDAIMAKAAPVKHTRKKLKVLLYSNPDAGKSVFLGTAPGNFIVDVEDGLISLGNHPDRVKDSVDSIPYKSFAGLEAIVNKFIEAPEALSKYETFSIDSLSDLHKRGLAEIVERHWANNPMMNNRYVAETEHHTENNEHIRRLVSSLRDMDRNLIMTAHARTLEPKDGPTKTFPDFSEKLANTIAGIVDVVGYLYVKEVDGKPTRFLRLHSNGNIMAKCRIGGFPDEIEDPTWDILYSMFLKNAS